MTNHERLEHRFTAFCTLLGKRVATSYNDIGAWRLDHTPTYGGYVIEEISNAGGGISQPFGHRRMTASELIERIDLAERAITIWKTL